MSDTIPTENYVDPVVLPPSRSHPNPAAQVSKPGTNFSTTDSLQSLADAVFQISTIIRSNTSDTCRACMAGLGVAQNLSFEYVKSFQGFVKRSLTQLPPDTLGRSRASSSAFATPSPRPTVGFAPPRNVRERLTPLPRSLCILYVLMTAYSIFPNLTRCIE